MKGRIGLVMADVLWLLLPYLSHIIIPSMCGIGLDDGCGIGLAWDEYAVGMQIVSNACDRS